MGIGIGDWRLGTEEVCGVAVLKAEPPRKRRIVRPQRARNEALAMANILIVPAVGVGGVEDGDAASNAA